MRRELCMSLKREMVECGEDVPEWIGGRPGSGKFCDVSVAANCSFPVVW